ncbi:sensor domain-containing phosphodiesterase [Salimicrobium flavidum]|uniref:EAL domain, c-di-GMP-specific phosphodiesterase class I (Or its enzymatically inactive variant) n=1 Tax=Salimicrobium flavidum TaxID=570947 RepID=A0A1N7KVW0_9BACI|nr:EAL domain-containing protein [Salimicrobium flavidum]SIS65749.1 EAL domain, c-di-GMP-specific phosphodiesterase class I (or its enzymatically inactive variant) [Salimicrobium flavidum]
MESSSSATKQECELRRGLQEEEFFLHYQPRMNIRTGEMMGAEALVRWSHPEYGVVYPDTFIPLAETTGLIIPLGEEVLRQACLQHKEWEMQGLGSIVVSVNFSPRQIYESGIVENVATILHETGMDPKFLEIEITENVMIDVDHVLGSLRGFKALGVSISLDDFGTGYSSLSYLKNLPIDKLKIDQSFVFTSTSDMNDQSLVKTIIAIGHQLNLGVVAEGVETREHLVLLQRNLCEEAQGYLFSKPVPASVFKEQMRVWEGMVKERGVGDAENSIWQREKAFALEREDLLRTVQKQQGFTFKYERRDGLFIHTMCEGGLLYKMDLLPEQVVGRPLRHFFSDQTAEYKEFYYERAWNGEQGVMYEGNINGVSYIASLSPVVSGNQVVEVIGSCIDISNRKRMEERLVQKEKSYQRLLDRLAEKLILLEDMGTITYMSASLRRMFEYEETDGQVAPLLKEIIVESDRLFMEENLKKLRASNMDTVSGYVTFVKKKGRLQEMKFRMMRITEEKDTSIALVLEKLRYA